MTAEDELRGYGFYIRPNVAGVLRLYTVYGVCGENGQMQPGEYVETQVAANSPLADLVSRAFAERAKNKKAPAL